MISTSRRSLLPLDIDLFVLCHRRLTSTGVRLTIPDQRLKRFPIDRSLHTLSVEGLVDGIFGGGCGKDGSVVRLQELTKFEVVAMVWVASET